MKKIKILFPLFLLLVLFIPSASAKKNDVTLYLFYSKNCPHCHNEREYLKTIKEENLNIVEYEVTTSDENNELMKLVAESLEEEAKYIPYTVIGTNTLVGFNEYTKDKIKEYVNECSKEECYDVVDNVKKTNSIVKKEIDEFNKSQYEKENENKSSKMTLPVLGKIDVKKVSLPLIAAVVGFVDGFNPCAMWVLIFLISMLLGMKDRKRMWAIGLSFIGASAFIYMLFMVAWLKVTLELSQIRFIQIIIAFIALIGSIINIKSYLNEKDKEAGCTVTDAKKRKNIIEKIKKFTTEKSFILAVLGAILLAVSVNFVELACSAGLPLLFTQILALNDLNSIQYICYILIYIFFYLIDDLVVFIIAMVSLKITGITNKYNKYSHLIGGIIMLIIGILMIFKPSWLMMNF